MPKTSNPIFSFTLPFFIALVFMLSVFTYKVGETFQKPIKTSPKKVLVQKIPERKVAVRRNRNVLGVSTKSVAQVIVETSASPEEKPTEYKSSVTNADGTRTETTGFVKDNVPQVTITQYDMFGAKTTEKTYTQQQYNELRDNDNSRLSGKKGIVTKENLPEKLAGLGYTYNATKVTIIKSEDGSRFKVPAYNTQKLFGVFKVKIPVDILVNVADGKVTISKSILVNLLDSLSK